jgi:elongation factor G
MHVQAVITDAVMDPALSNEVAFEVAAADAVRKALHDNIILLEPIMRLEVQVPEEYLGVVLTDLQSRRALLEEEIIMRGKWRVVPALVPLARMFDYTDKVRSLTQGRASPSMEPHSYAPAPEEVLRAMLDPDVVTSF